MKKKNVILLILLFLVVICLFTGISISIFTYFGRGNTNNVIETGKIIFSYSDALKKGNGINIEDAYPIVDYDGKRLANENEYFDFSVTASTTKIDLNYEIVVLKQDGSTLDDRFVKIYLTELDGTDEKEVPLMEKEVPTYADLKQTNNKLLNGKTVYYGTVKGGEVAYGKKFRLRMWLRMPGEDKNYYDMLQDKTFKLKVNVAAVGASN